MSKCKSQDYSVREILNSIRGELYGVYAGRTILVASYKSQQMADAVCDCLNYDPLWFDKMYWKQYKSARSVQ